MNQNEMIWVKRREFNTAIGKKGDFVETNIRMTRQQFANITNDEFYIESQDDKSKACPLTLTEIPDPTKKAKTEGQDLLKMNVKDLTALAIEEGIDTEADGFSFKKVDLIAAIEAKRNEATEI